MKIYAAFQLAIHPVLDKHFVLVSALKKRSDWIKELLSSENGIVCGTGGGSSWDEYWLKWSCRSTNQHLLFNVRRRQKDETQYTLMAASTFIEIESRRFGLHVTLNHGIHREALVSEEALTGSSSFFPRLMLNSWRWKYVRLFSIRDLMKWVLGRWTMMWHALCFSSEKRWISWTLQCWWNILWLRRSKSC